MVSRGNVAGAKRKHGVPIGSCVRTVSVGGSVDVADGDNNATKQSEPFLRFSHVDVPRNTIQSVGSYLQMPTLRTTNREAYAFVRKHGLVRPGALEEIGIPRANVARWATEGLLVRVARGLYALPNQDFGEHDTLAQVAKLVPDGIVCLLSALRFHELTTQNPSEVWLGIDRKARKPKLHWPPLHIVWWSDVVLTEGIIVVNVAGVTIRITSPARTVADCFKYRNKIGLDVAIEALRDFRRKK